LFKKFDIDRDGEGGNKTEEFLKILQAYNPIILTAKDRKIMVRGQPG
jgi:hypothetical protein